MFQHCKYSFHLDFTIVQIGNSLTPNRYILLNGLTFAHFCCVFRFMIDTDQSGCWPNSSKEATLSKFFCVFN
jgi:hypothetical protein